MGIEHILTSCSHDPSIVLDEFDVHIRQNTSHDICNVLVCCSLVPAKVSHERADVNVVVTEEC